MGFGNFISGQFIDVIEYVDESNKLLVHKFTRYGNEIKKGAQLIVRPGQAAIFVYRGQIADCFRPGHYKLTTASLPVLSSLAAIPHLFNSPIKSDVYFVNTTQFVGNKWGTKNPIIKRDAEIGIVRMTAFGTYSFRVVDARLFMNEIFGSRKLDMTYDIIKYLSSIVGESIARGLGEQAQSVLDMAVHYGDLSGTLADYANKKANPLGLEIPEAVIENIGLPEEVEKMMDEQSGIGLASRNMDVFVQYQSARAIRDAARQPGGLSGIGAGIAVGNAVARNIGGSLCAGNDIASKPGGAQTLAEELEKYKELLDKEILTQSEFDIIKSELLKKLTT